MRKTRKTMKRIVSVLLALAMVITSVSYTPEMVSAADWTKIAGAAHQGGNFTALCYQVAKGQESQPITAYSGGYFLNVYPEGLDSENAEVYFDEGQTTEGKTPFEGGHKVHDADHYQIGLGLTQGSANNIQPNTYYSLRFVYGEHDVVYYFYTGENPEGTPEPGPEPQTGNIAEGKQWQAWSNVTTNWDNIGDSADGYTLSGDKGNIGSDWWHIQTQIADITFAADTSYTCEFTLTAPAPKKFTVDENTNGDRELFIEKEGGEWSNNDNGTYSYKYVGTYESKEATTKTIRIALGYHNGTNEGVPEYVKGIKDSNDYTTNTPYTFTVSGFKIVNSEEYVPVPTATAEVGEDGAVKVNIIANAQEEEGTTYAIFVDGVLKEKVNEAGEHTLTGLESGSHEVTVAAIHDGYYSELTAPITVVVGGEKTVQQMLSDSLYNLAYKKNVTPYAHAHQGEATFITDGILNGQGAALSDADDTWNTPGGEVYATVDLGALYDASTIDKILVQYMTNDAGANVADKSYSIQYSTDNQNWYDAVPEKTVPAADINKEDNAERYTLDDVSGVTGAVQYVRAYYPKTGNWGIQVGEIAVFDTDQNQKTVEKTEVEKPSLQNVIGGAGKITGTITAPDSKHEYTYTIYVDGEVFKTGVSDGDFELQINPGEYDVSVSAVYNGFYSEKTEAKHVNVTQVVYTPLDEADYPKVASDAWKQVQDRTDYWYYTPDDGTIIIWNNNAEPGVIQPGLSTDLFEAKIGDVALEKGDGTYMKMLESAFTQNGIYQVDLNNWQNSGTSRKFYIRKGALPNYAVTGITVTAVTEDSATFNWTPSEDAIEKGYTYQIFVDGSLVEDNINAGTGTYAWSGDLSDQKPHTLVIKTVDAEGNVVAESEEETFGYGIVPVPDLAVTNVEISVQDDDYSEGKTLTVTTTFKNISAVDFPLPEKSLVVWPCYNGGTRLEGTVGGNYMVVTDQPQYANCFTADKSALLPGATFTYTYQKVLTEEMLTGTYTIGARIGDEKGITAELSGNDMKEVLISPYTLPAIENLRATLTSTGNVTVGWDKLGDENDKHYTYEIYVDETKQEGLVVNENQDGDRMYVVLNGLDNGRHQIEVRRTLETESSPKATTYCVVYDPSTITWTQWRNNRTQDIDNDTWWYAKNFMDGNMIYEDPNRGPQITTDGLWFQFILSKDGSGDGALYMQNSTTVNINGVSYPVERAAGEDVLAYQPAGDDKIYLSHKLFPVEKDVRTVEFTISVTGTMQGEEVTKTILVKLVNEDYHTADLKYVADEDPEGNLEKKGHVIFTWKDQSHVANHGYKIHYYAYDDDKYNPNTPETNEETVVWVTRGEGKGHYTVNKNGSMSYHLTENEIYLRSNTEIRVVPVIDAEGTEAKEEVGMAVGQAELTFYGDPTAETGAYVSPTEKSKLLFKVINIGTAAVSTKALHEGLNLLQIKVSEYTDASRTELVPAGEHANPLTFDHNLDEDDVLPGEIITAEHDHLFKTRDTYYFTAEIDPNNYIYEFDADENNVHDYDIRAAYKGHLEIQQKEGGGYKAIFAPDQSLWAGGVQPGVTQQSPTDFEISYYDHGELKTCRIKNTGSLPQVSKPEWGEHVFELDLPDIEHIDSDMPVTIAAVYDDGSTAVFADDTPFWQETEMDWTPIKEEGSDEPFDFNISRTTSNVEYKILSAGSHYDNYHYQNIIYKNNPYKGSINRFFIENSDYVGYTANDKDAPGNGNYFTTTLETAKLTPEEWEEYESGRKTIEEVGLSYRAVRNGNMKNGEDGYLEANPLAPYWWDGSGLQIDFVDAGLGKYTIVRITGAEPGENLVIAFRIVTEEGDGWFRIAPAQDDTDTVHSLYYHDLNTHIEDATYYGDMSDKYLASLAGYHSTHIAIHTDSQKPVNLNGFKVMMAPAKLDANGKVDEPKDLDDYKTYASGDAEGIAGGDGTNINFNMARAIQDFPVHSGKSGRQNFYYFIRVYTDTVNEPDYYIEMPIRVSANIPEIETLPEENIKDVTSDSDSLSVTFTPTQTGIDKKYVYDIYLDDKLITEATDLGPSAGEDITVSLPVPADKQEELNRDGSKFEIKIVSKWCYEADNSDTDHWYDDGSGEETNHYQYTETVYNFINKLIDGEVKVQGFQINTNKEAGGVSEYMPSMRVVSSVGKAILDNSRIRHTVKSYGTLIAYETEGNSLTEKDMRRDSGSQYVTDVPATTHLSKWGDDKDNYYYAVNLKQINYNYNKLKANYYYRAYAILDNDDVVYSDNIYKVNTYEIAENLYENKHMYTKEGHDFLYNEILNIVSMNENAKDIGHAMTTKLNVTDMNSKEYEYINTAYKDIIYYALTGKGYTYQNREATFTSKTLGEKKEAELLGWLTKATDSSEVTTLHEWIEKYVDTIDQKNASGTKYKGFYKKVDYQWDNNLYKGYGIKK